MEGGVAPNPPEQEAEERNKIEATQAEVLARPTALREELGAVLSRSSALSGECVSLPSRCRGLVRAVGAELGLLEGRVKACRARAAALAEGEGVATLGK
ncbi:hypothetical protein LSM04_002924 [Trypanosoma melophagium]|uniref:uncharacterized protein n=1 Tax=Trypanosoma melophagium TaxID=715481 RepID=UPI003519F3D7|nr:hypothetical protein LSM04_002924 [Trypanosoma melophagium]